MSLIQFITLRRALPRHLIWAVLCAVWMAALAPTVSTLLWAQGRVLVEVCSSAGTRLVALDTSPSDERPADTHEGKHCPYCLLQQDQALPPVHLAVWRAPVVFSQDLPRFLSAVRHVRTAWVHLPSRAPPATLV